MARDGTKDASPLMRDHDDWLAKHSGTINGAGPEKIETSENELQPIEDMYSGWIAKRFTTYDDVPDHAVQGVIHGGERYWLIPPTTLNKERVKRGITKIPGGREKIETSENELQPMREFETGATRDTDNGKYDYEGFLSPEVLEEFAKYMHEHRVQKDGELRASDNWQKGIPKDAYMKSLWRHFHDAWKGHRHGNITKAMLCAIMFNTMGYLFEIIQEENNDSN